MCQNGTHGHRSFYLFVLSGVGPIELPIQWVPEVNRPELGADCSFPCTSEFNINLFAITHSNIVVKIECSCTFGFMSWTGTALLSSLFHDVGRDSSVGIATRYGLEGPGIEARWGGRDFPHPSRPALGPTQPPIQWVPGLFQGQSGRGVALTTHPIWRRG
jgi:hypothetical protein